MVSESDGRPVAVGGGYTLFGNAGTALRAWSAVGLILRAPRERDRRAVDVRDMAGAASLRGPMPDLSDRLAQAMRDDAARAVDEGVVRSVSDGDIAAVLGIGYAPVRGGSLCTLEMIGTVHAGATPRRLEGTHGPRFAPAPVLVRHAERGTQFSSTN